MVKKPISRRINAKIFEIVERPHLLILPLPKFYQMMRVGSGASCTFGHRPPIYLCAIDSCYFLHFITIRLQGLMFIASINFSLPFML